MISPQTDDQSNLYRHRYGRLSSPWCFLYAILLITLLFSLKLQAGEIYTWVDAQGVTHFSQQPPPHQKADKVFSEDIEPKKIGSVTPVKSLEAKTVSESEKTAAIIKQKDAAQAKSICENAKHSLNVLMTHSRLTQKNNQTGDSVVMTEEQRQAAISKQQEKVSLFCSD
ncbi:DUF4124 domain-containing protein [Shewanella youngdeokensis]|uniref:DUF4124 domain-containing protein n=1 Tax=Shewanella youngdeokensis TaxID=2999068 RepID=A0ABZ0K035_9GAMM|nr:DUF4124 domain-containing protein [Shewanella sp. DAU334]